MPRRTARQRDVNDFIRSFLYFYKVNQARQKLRARRLQRQAQLEPLSVIMSSDIDIDIDTPSLSTSESDPMASDTPSSCSNTSSSQLNSLGDGTEDSSAFQSEFNFSNESIEFFSLNAYYSSSNVDTDASSQSSRSTSSDAAINSILDSSSDSEGGFDADIEEEWSSGDDSDFVATNKSSLTRNIGRFVRKSVQKLYKSRYMHPRKNIQRSKAEMREILEVDKHERPADFRLYLRVNPTTFDQMVEQLSAHPVFHNNSANGQMPLEDQLAIVLYRFGHFGNAAGISKVARWSGYGKGTVLLVTRRVMMAILDKEFMAHAVRLPSEMEKENAKKWVEDHSCKAWRDGWCMVDGTLVPLFDKPFWYGESYFDRKCNYSLNIQIINLPNLRIIDYGYGFTGSTHDATAWEKTYIHSEHTAIFNENEFIWADSAYPIDVWVVAPYKKPDSDVPENAQYNNHVSMVRIRSEHAIGFLKGRFQSLKGLRVNIVDEGSHKFATYWVVSCIGLHSFAMDCEAQERALAGEASSADEDPFILQGLSTESDGEQLPFIPPRSNYIGHQTRATSLTAGKARREHLKSAILQHKQARRERHIQREHGQGSSAEDSD